MDDMKTKFKVVILGGGGRGYGYGCFLLEHPDEFEISAVCDINPEQLEKCRKRMNLSEDILFTDEETLFEEKRGDIMVIATYDKDHVRQCIRAMKQGYDILLEKPISDSREEIEALLKTQEETGKIVAVCHELRYGVMFEKLYELLKSGTIGDLIAIDAMERVAYWHQAQAYVRIQSVVNDIAHPTILAKCSHDLDLIQHYAGEECDTVSSVGELSFFCEKNAPEGSSERCIECKYMDTCPYSAKRIYIDGWHEKGCPEFDWPYSKVSLKRPTTEADLYEGIKTTYFGQCVFRCQIDTNEHVVDHQMVQMKFKNGVIATLKMLFAAEPGRRINLFGTHGELLMDERTNTIEVRPYGEKMQTIDYNTLFENGNAHGGGDARLIEELYSVMRGEKENRTSLRESVESHLIGIAAEESRLDGGKAVKVHK